jgi:RNA polymerase sigma-70 factor (ECF subfamily)
MEEMQIADKEDEEIIEPDYNVDQVKEAMSQLPDGYRTILSLYLFEGFDHEEISEVLKISSSTSRSQYLRAKKKLIELIKKTEYVG